MKISKTSTGKPFAIIYTHSLLVGSMTFIKSHAEALVRFCAFYVGAHRVDGLELPGDRCEVVNRGGIVGSVRELAFRQWGHTPGFIRRLEHMHPAIVHVHFGTSGPAGLTLARKLGVPLVVTFHGKDATMTEAEARRSRRGRELLRHKKTLINATDTFIAVSTFVQQSMVKNGYPEKKITLLRNGIDLEFFRPSPDAPHTPTILFVGRFVEKKGGEYLIKAAEVLRQLGVSFNLVMIGDGPLQGTIEAAADRAGVSVEFPGFLPVDEVRQWIDRATVVAVPSVTASNGDSEGLPTILLEAQAMATPVVATRHSGIPEGVIDGVTAELVDEKDVKALAAQLRSFLESPGKTQQFGQAARQYVEKNFDLNTQVAKLENLYLAAMERHGHTRT